MTDFDAKHVTVAAVPHGHEQPAVIVRKALARYEEPVDALVLLVPAGTWREARDRIFAALGTAPMSTESDLATAVYYEGNLRRMMEGGAYSADASEGFQHSPEEGQ